MLLESFVNQSADSFSFSRKQASDFAKKVATDFNPIHDEDAKRFCVPGDLLFAYLLSRYGLTEQLSCQFSGMVGAETLLHCKTQPSQIQICDQQDKVYLTLQHGGACLHNAAIIEPLIKDYVRFSGQNFPHILQPLMAKHQVMINPQRPLVIYESMALSFSRLPRQRVELTLAASSLDVDGKRGNALLEFALTEQGELIGKGEKRMILSNLMPYDEQQMQQMITAYNSRKAAA
ncbi:DUF3581 family protein [Chromatiaceae bacterium AAb-1]|nr:DUF3581 family protein [Chromatiaceae bacterium AAb-1]